MDTKIFDLKDASVYEEALNVAAAAIKAGQLVVFPTETVYGLGANALDSEAVKNIYQAKGRPSDNPLIVHLADFADAEKYVSSIPEAAQRLAESYMPGPITLIMPKAEIIPPIVSAGGDTVGIRVPLSRFARDFIARCQLPIAAPSANISGRPSPTSERYALEDMDGRAAVILLGGDCDIGVESTVVDCTKNAVRVLRPGAISAAELNELVDVDSASLSTEEREHPKAPGMKYRHYKPKGEVVVLDGCDEAAVKYLRAQVLTDNCAVLAYDTILAQLDCAHRLSLGSRGDSATAAHNLFAHFRLCDTLNITKIYVLASTNSGIGAAYMNRLLKAADCVIELDSPKKVLFVCTGNTCRSPMAEGIMNLRANGLFFAESAGIHAEAKMPPSENAAAVCKAHGIDISEHHARTLMHDDIANADIVLCMGYSHKQALLMQHPEYAGKVRTLAEYAGESGDIADPYGQNLAVYEQTFAQLARYIDMIISSERNTTK